jgi:hypothetical protein
VLGEVRPGRGAELVERRRVALVGRVRADELDDQRREDRDDDEEHDHDGSDQRDLVRPQAAKEQLERGPGGDLAAALTTAAASSCAMSTVAVLIAAWVRFSLLLAELRSLLTPSVPGRIIGRLGLT